MNLKEFRELFNEFEAKYPDLFMAKRTGFMNRVTARILKVGEHHNVGIIIERKYGGMKVLAEDEELKSYIRQISKEITEEEVARLAADILLTLYIQEVGDGN